MEQLTKTAPIEAVPIVSEMPETTEQPTLADMLTICKDEIDLLGEICKGYCGQAGRRAGCRSECGTSRRSKDD